MARKKSNFRWVRDDDAADGALSPAVPALPEAEGEVDAEDGVRTRPERKEHRARMHDLKELTNRIAELPLGQRQALPLDPETHAEIDRLAHAQGPDRRRRLMRARLLLAQNDLDAVLEALGGTTAAVTLERRVVSWRTRLVSGDDTVIQAFIEAYPSADRQALWGSLREVRADPAAMPRLSRMIRETLKQA